jgi:hypothetical protein
MMGRLVTALAGPLIETVKLRAYAAALFCAAAASLLFALVFGLVAVRHWIVVTFNSQYPDLWMALAFVVIALPLIAVGLSLHSQKPKANPTLDLALLAGPPALRLVSRKISPQAVAIGVVLVAGVALGRRFAARAPS